jgi:hypothetical protein
MANNHNNNQMNPLRALLRSEITWIISIVVVVWSFVATVVMPIQALQLGQAKIQEQLNSESKRYVDNEIRISNLEKNQERVMTLLSIKEQK